MKRLLTLCLLLPFSGAGFATPPASAPAETDAAVQQQMAALQTRMRDLASQMATLSAKLGDEARASALHYFADSRRGMLGMAVGTGARGLRVDAVTPGGPAERAGLQAGDTITAIDGKPVDAFDVASETALWNAQVGQPVVLTIERDGKPRTMRVMPERLQPADVQASIRAAELAAEQASARVRSPEFQRQIQRSIDEAMKSASAARGVAFGNHPWIASMSPWFGLNLAPLNPDLGSYFGTRHGALVLSRNDRQFPELRPGDVITRVDGRSVARPDDAMRALREAATDKPVAVTLRRHGKTITLAMKVPPRWGMIPLPPPAPPAPPAVPPAPPAPPAPSAAPLPAPPPPAPPGSGRAA